MNIIGYEFENIELLKTAITTQAARNEHPQSITSDYELLGTLGDSALKFILTLKKYQESATKEILTMKRVNIENNKKLANIAREMGIKPLLCLGKDGNNPDKDDGEMLATALEAIIGAIYLDREDLGSVIRFVDEKISAAQVDEGDLKDPMSRINEEVLKIYEIPPKFEYFDVGNEYTHSWVAELTIKGKSIGRFEGASKNEAKLKAAIYALNHREKWVPIP